MDETYSFLGIGWGFPPFFRDAGGKTDMVSGTKDVEESLKIILSTLPKERVMRPDFGCDLSSFAFQNVNDSFLQKAQETVRQALALYEPRIELESVTMDTDEDDGKVMINIDYIVIESNSRRNMVYPYYLEESQILDF